jgi:segregation and condensation protein A
MSEQGGVRSTGSFSVELPLFVGPFRLLADLILDQRIDVCDVPVAKVTDLYLGYSKEAESWSLEEATWFVVICAIMLELKVGRLIPRNAALDEEDLVGVSPDLLYARSLELSAFRQIAGDLGRRMEAESHHFPREVGPPRELLHLYPDVLEKVPAEDLAGLAAALLRPPPSLDLHHVTPIGYSMEDAVAAVTTRLGRVGAASFRELVADCRERMHVVIRFLALLELYREGKVDLEQAETFGDIEVRWQGEVEA